MGLNYKTTHIQNITKTQSLTFPKKVWIIMPETIRNRPTKEDHKMVSFKIREMMSRDKNGDKKTNLLTTAVLDAFKSAYCHMMKGMLISNKPTYEDANSAFVEKLSVEPVAAKSTAEAMKPMPNEIQSCTIVSTLLRIFKIQ